MHIAVYKAMKKQMETKEKLLTERLAVMKISAREAFNSSSKN